MLGGGRYDKLVQELGGQPTPAAGFAVGIERVIASLRRKEEEERKLVNYPDLPENFEVATGAADGFF